MALVELKRCQKCGMEKPLEEFGFRFPKLGIRQSWCKTCFAEYKQAWYVQNRADHLAHVKERRARLEDENQNRMWRYLAEHPCVDCGERDPVVLQFDHRRDKRREISFMVCSGWAWATVLEEIAKCEVRCANCHARRTARERGIYERKHMMLHAIPPVDPPAITHVCNTIN